MEVKSWPSVSEVLKTLEAHVEKNSDPTPRDCTKLKIGDVVRQGDIYLQLVDKSDVELIGKIANRQLVPGTSNGSKHIVKNLPGVDVYKSTPSEKLRLPNAPNIEIATGPAIMAGVDFPVEHPTHPHCLFSGDVVIQVWYQIDKKTNERSLD